VLPDSDLAKYLWVTNSLKKSVGGYIDRLLLPIRLEAERAAIGLGFEAGSNLASEVADEFDHWEARGFDEVNCWRGRLTTAEWHRAQCINALEPILNGRKFLDGSGLDEGSRAPRWLRGGPAPAAPHGWDRCRR
jgi:hypothetical protein